MTARGKSRRDGMREMREEDMRERIKGSGVLRQYIESIDEIKDLDRGENFRSDLDAIKAQNDVRKVLLDKVLPTLKAQDVNVEGGLKVVAIDMTGIDYGDEEEAED